MGSLLGHIFEGVAFIIMGLWWMYQVWKRYIQVGGTHRYETGISFNTQFRGTTINIEVYAKIFVSIGGLLIEVFNNGWHTEFVSSDGSLYRISSLQHISIYTLFIFHGIIDLLRYKKLLIIEGLDYFSLALAFTWYGMIFYFHTNSGHSDRMETIVHSLGVLWCFGAAISILWEYQTTNKFLPNYCRSLMVLCLGTWFTHIPFYLYSPNNFPGTRPNPRWDRNDVRNVQFIATMFGFHILFNMTLTTLGYVVMRMIRTRRGGVKGHVAFHRLPDDASELEEKTCLLEEKL